MLLKVAVSEQGIACVCSTRVCKSDIYLHLGSNTNRGIACVCSTRVCKSDIYLHLPGKATKTIIHPSQGGQPLFSVLFSSCELFLLHSSLCLSYLCMWFPPAHISLHFLDRSPVDLDTLHSCCCLCSFIQDNYWDISIPYHVSLAFST